MRRLIAGAVCVLSLALLARAHAAGHAPVRLASETRDRFAAAMQSYRAGDWATAARELGEAAGARATAQQAADQAPDSRAAPAAVTLAAEQSSRAGDEAGAALLWRR